MPFACSYLMLTILACQLFCSIVTKGFRIVFLTGRGSRNNRLDVCCDVTKDPHPGITNALFTTARRGRFGKTGLSLRFRSNSGCFLQ